MAPEKKWRRFEDLVAEIQRSLSPTARLTQNERIVGRITETPREIDVSVRELVGQYEMFIAIDCKDYKDAVNVKTVEEFMGLLEDVGANKGVIVSAKGFSPTARTRARKAGIQLYRPLSSGDHEWKQLVSIPTVAEIRFVKSVMLQLSGTARNMRLPSDTAEYSRMIAYRADGSEQGRVSHLVDSALRYSGRPPKVGPQLVDVGERPLFLRGSAGDFEVDLKAEVVVGSDLWFENLPLSEVKGFQDDDTGQMVLGNFVVQPIHVNEITRRWTKVASLSDLAVKPMMNLITLREINPSGRKMPPTFLGFEMDRSKGSVSVTIEEAEEDETPAVDPKPSPS